MSTTDAYMRIICDTCNEEDEITLPFTYPNLSGKGGYYDHKRISLPEGWMRRGVDVHACPNCWLNVHWSPSVNETRS